MAQLTQFFVVNTSSDTPSVTECGVTGLGRLFAGTPKHEEGCYAIFDNLKDANAHARKLGLIVSIKRRLRAQSLDGLERILYSIDNPRT